MTPGSGAPLLVVRGLTKHFPIRGGILNREVARAQAVDGVDFTVFEGETLGVVGESGCGKSTMARLLMGLIPADRGEIVLSGQVVGGDGGVSVRDMRRHVQMVFQDSYSSLNPRLPVADTIAFGPLAQGVPTGEARRRVEDLLVKVGLDPGQFRHRYPHELSGGQRQRVNIARALALQPRLLILDEAVSALDKSVEAQVLNLLLDLKAEMGLTFVFISHDLNVVHYVSDRVLVMYLGKVVEIGPAEALYDRPRHPYTRALLAAMPSMDPDRPIEEAPIIGDPPNPIEPPPGCRFHTRCPHAEPVCAEREPGLAEEPTSPGHLVACHMEDPGSGHSQARPP